MYVLLGHLTSSARAHQRLLARKGCGGGGRGKGIDVNVNEVAHPPDARASDALIAEDDNVPPASPRSLYGSILPPFKSCVLATHRSKFVQFAVFVLCGLDATDATDATDDADKAPHMPWLTSP